MGANKKWIPIAIAAVVVLAIAGIVIGITINNKSRGFQVSEITSDVQATDDEGDSADVMGNGSDGSAEQNADSIGNTKKPDDNATDMAKTQSAKLSEEDARAAIEKLLDEVDNFSYIALLDYSDSSSLSKTGDSIDLNIEPRNVTRAAGMSSLVQKGEMISLEDGEYGAVYIEPDSLNQAAKDIFGKTADIESLGRRWNHVYDVTLYDGKPVIMWTEYETELESFTIDTSIDVSDGHYRAVQDVYHGYWGYADYNKSNFRFTYEFRVSSGSQFGMVISSINIERISEDYELGRGDSEYIDSDYDDSEMDTSYVNDPFDEPDMEGFYGIWCFASKDRSEAELQADKLTELGLNGAVYMSSDWENLNADHYYVVTAGTYAYEGAAEGVLKVVKLAGYDSAYIKFSGEHRDN